MRVVRSPAGREIDATPIGSPFSARIRPPGVMAWTVASANGIAGGESFQRGR
jgi:hypothetical protein